MRARRSLWTMVALLAAIGVALVIRGQGASGRPPSAEGRPAVEPAAGLALEGLARPARVLPLPEGASTPPAAPLLAESVVTDDGEIYSVKPEPWQIALILRLTAPGSGEAVSISEWIVAGNVFPVPSGRVPRLPVVPGRWISVHLREARRADGSWRFLSERLAIEIPLPAPDELRVAVPTLEDLTHDPLWLVPVDAKSGTVLPGGTWEPPPRRSDLAPIAADADGRIAVPLAVLRSTIEQGVEPYVALRKGLTLPNQGRGQAEGVSALTLSQVRQLIEGGELRVPIALRAEGGDERRLRLLDPDGAPASRVRVVVQDYKHGELRLWTNARGILSWQGSALESSQVEIFTADGWLREVFELPAGSGLGDEPARVVLPETALVTLEFVLPDDAGASRDGLPRDLDLGIFGRLYPPAGDPGPPAVAGVPERVDNTGGTILDTQLDFNAPRVRLRVPLRRELQLSTVIAPVHPEGHGLPVLFDFVLDAPVARLVFDWPPTRILSRHDR